MKIATYNVRNLFDPGTYIDDQKSEPVQEGFFNERIAYFTKQLGALDLDIICLQEIGGERGVKMLGDTLGYDYFFAKPNSRGIRMAVLYKKALSPYIVAQSVSFGELALPAIITKGDTDVLPKLAQRRDVLVVDLAIPDFPPTRIVTFHLKSLIPSFLEGDDMEGDVEAYTDAKFRSVLYKMMELRALRIYANTSLQEGKEVVFLGDFNEHSNSSGIDILKSSLSDALRLTDCMVTYGGDKTTHIHRGNKLTFDTILVSSKLHERIKSVSVDNKTLRDYSLLPWGEVEHEIESDHALVYVEL